MAIDKLRLKKIQPMRQLGFLLGTVFLLGGCHSLNAIQNRPQPLPQDQYIQVYLIVYGISKQIHIHFFLFDLFFLNYSDLKYIQFSLQYLSLYIQYNFLHQ